MRMHYGSRHSFKKLFGHTSVGDFSGNVTTPAVIRKKKEKKNSISIFLFFIFFLLDFFRLVDVPSQVQGRVAKSSENAALCRSLSGPGTQPRAR
jgi:hypothetical protein